VSCCLRDYLDFAAGVEANFLVNSLTVYRSL